MEKYIIRPAVESDADKIAELEHLCFPVEEAASKVDFVNRLNVYAIHFLLLESDYTLIISEGSAQRNAFCRTR